MDSNRLASPTKKNHTRGPSFGERRRTVGPLDDPSESLGARAAPATQLPQDIMSESVTLIAPPPVSQAAPVPEQSPSPMPPKDYSFLVEPSIFHPLPHLELPEPLRNQSQRDAPLSSLLLSSHLRSAAITAANNLTSTPPTDSLTIFNLWYVRLACLTLISTGATQIAAQEIKVFGDLTSSFYRDPVANDHAVPWGLRVLAIRLQAIGYSDWRRCLEHFYVLAKEARSEAAKNKDDPELRKLWKERLWDLGIRVGSALVETGDLEGATRHLEGLMVGANDGTQEEMFKRNYKVRCMLALLYVQIGNIRAARACFNDVDLTDEGDKFRKKVVETFCMMGDNKFVDAVESWKSLLEQWEAAPEGQLPYGKEMIRQNLAVCLLYIGKLPDARKMMESIVDDDKKAFHALAFNLCTIFELCSDDAKSLKLELAGKIANLGVELTNSSFKL